ncbi:MAG: porin [Rikenellaceae bacterium]
MKKIFTLIFTLSTLLAVAQESEEKKTKIEFPKISGYVQGSYSANEDANGFSVQRVRLSIKGTIGDQFLYTIQSDLKGPSLVDGFVGYTPCKYFNLKLGQYKVPFSLENTDASPTGMEFIEYPLGLRMLQGISSVYKSASSFADIGLTAYGRIIKGDDFDYLSYDLGVFNGEGGNSSDANKSKDISARLIARPIKEFKLTASYYKAETGANYDKRDLFSAGAMYSNDKVTVRTEAYLGDSDLSFLSKDDVISKSIYGLVAYNITPKFNLAARYDFFMLDSTNKNYNQTNYTVGLSYRPIKYFRAMLNYTYADYASDDNTNTIAVSLFGMF